MLLVLNLRIKMSIVVPRLLLRLKFNCDLLRQAVAQLLPLPVSLVQLHFGGGTVQRA
jgi:hypothetical protein